MKIAHVITRLIVGGAQENTLLTCAGLRLRGHDVTLIAGPETGPEGSMWPRAEATCGRCLRVPELRRAVAPIMDWRGAGVLAGIFRAEQFDVVHTHSSKAGILARWAARRARVPCIVHTIHGMSFNRTQSGLVRRFYALLERRAARWTHGLISVADAMTAQAVAAGIAPRERFVTIRSGMEVDHFAPDVTTRTEVRSRWNIPEDAVVVGTIARLFRNKGYEDLLAALPRIAASCPQARFVWIGDGAQRGEYERQLVKLNLRDRVHLTGLVPSARDSRVAHRVRRAGPRLALGGIAAEHRTSRADRSAGGKFRQRRRPRGHRRRRVGLRGGVGRSRGAGRARGPADRGCGSAPADGSSRPPQVPAHVRSPQNGGRNRRAVSALAARRTIATLKRRSPSSRRGLLPYAVFRKLRQSVHAKIPRPTAINTWLAP
jgi:glycosyltransferase involved in cell wall biosynthesis